MACKHEGGTEPCQRYTSGKCKVRQRSISRKYYRDNCNASDLDATCANAGQAAEHFVAADLLSRGFKVTKPLNTNTPDDLYAKIDGVWLSFQVKSAVFNTKLGRLTTARIRRKNITSDVLALVHMASRSTRYIDMREGTEWQFSNSTAERASALPNNESATHKLSPASSVTSVVSSSTCSSVVLRGSKQESTEKETVSVRIAEYADYWPSEDQDAETSDEEVGVVSHPPKPEVDAEVE